MKRKNRLWYSKKYNYFIILPDDPPKKVWDFITTMILFVVFFLTPYRIAFTDNNEIWWIVIDSLIDFMFLLDIFVTFFSAYYNNEYILIDKWSKIFWNYIFGWFAIDVISIIPFNYLLGGNDYNALAKLTRF